MCQAYGRRLLSPLRFWWIRFKEKERTQPSSHFQLQYAHIHFKLSSHQIPSQKWTSPCLSTLWFDFPFPIPSYTKMGWSATLSSLQGRCTSLSTLIAGLSSSKPKAKKGCNLVCLKDLALLRCPRLKTMATLNSLSSSVWPMFVLYPFYCTFVFTFSVCFFSVDPFFTYLCELLPRSYLYTLYYDSSFYLK